MIDNSNYDLALSWNWEYDIDFVNILKNIASYNNIKILEITPRNFEYILNLLIEGKASYKVYLDRASDSDRRFVKIYEVMKNKNVYMINSYEKIYFASDKATMHLELINAGINSPYTIILPPYNENSTLKDIDLKLVGNNFIIKPACGGGGEGVILNINSIEEIQNARKHFPNDKYLIQSYIEPIYIDSMPAWFRVIFCFNEVFMCWWHPQTHIYTEITEEEITKFNLNNLKEIVSKIFNICKLEIFSTEIALGREGKFIVIDYVNDQIDLRLKSKHIDGVPDRIVFKIAENIIKNTLLLISK